MSAERDPFLRQGKGYEVRDLSFKPVVAFSIALAAMVILFAAGMWVLYGYLGERVTELAASERPLARERRRMEPPEPRLQSTPRKDLVELRRWEDQVLESYAWVDHERGIVRIPIEDALELTAKRGLPSVVTEQP